MSTLYGILILFTIYCGLIAADQRIQLPLFELKKNLRKSAGLRFFEECRFEINGGIYEPQPLFANSGKLTFLEPEIDGVVRINGGEEIDMYCTGSFIGSFNGTKRITATCLQNQHFLVDGVIHDFEEFVCSAWPVSSARRTRRTCNGGTTLAEVGFEVETGFMSIMDICFDEDKEVTRYVHHKLTPSSAAYQRSVSRPNFITGNEFFNGKNVDQIYTKVQHQAMFNEILGGDFSHLFNDSKSFYLARGHMAAKVDFIFGAPQKATFYFINAAPQWQRFNAGNWERVEDGVRRWVSDNQLFVDCYTGVWGVSTLPDINGVEQELYLTFDENHNGLIPVPMLYFRVVIEPSTKRGIVLIGVNNPHLTMKDILEKYVICNDVSDLVTFVNWNKNDISSGYSYACDVNDFAKVNKDLPDFEVNSLLI